MLSIVQAQNLSGSRNAIALTRQFTQEDLALRYAQGGLPYVSEHAAYLTVYVRPEAQLTLPRLQALARQLHAEAKAANFKWVAVLAVNCLAWERWMIDAGKPIEPGLFDGHEELTDLLAKNHPPYALDGGDLFFHIQSRDEAKVVRVARRICADLQDVVDETRTNFTVGDSLHGGRIYGGRMLHGLISSVDPICFSARALIGAELPRHKGGCFCLTQRFIHNWQFLLGMADNEIENLIGRDHQGNIISNDDERAHIKLVRVNDDQGLNYRLVGQSQPFRGASWYTLERKGKGRDPFRVRAQAVKGSAGLPAKEDGIYQLSYAKSFKALSTVLRSMLGDKPGFIKCRHLNFSQADQGNLWYVPCAQELGLEAPHPTLTVLMNSFFDVHSPNGRMFYNSRDFLYRVGNGHAPMTPPLTDRVIELLGYTFSRWHDTWYRRRPAPELGHLRDYLSKSERALMNASLAERKGLAVKKTLDILSQPELGQPFDTYRLHPRELIVGVVPDFTLGSGFEAMSCLNEAQGEVTKAFLLNLNDSGAAGHNVPDYQKLLRLGLGGLKKESSARLLKAPNAAKKAFYQSVIYALEGATLYFENYSALARAKYQATRDKNSPDAQNLDAVARRLARLANQPPKSFADAAQLVFGMHCCLHLSGESTSLGRLDQLLFPFLQADQISEAAAQEIIDCLWIKLNEKVLLNHRHFNDRLSRGSGAITYEGGDFPQGAALNQWVQQVTVGGCIANDANAPQDGCNTVTRLCLRAARRLPLNAPCLSFRASRATPTAFLREVAETILSGGGHPFLINEDKVIAGLMHSGKAPDGRQILARADVRDVVCDGCFEAMPAGRCEFAFSFVPVPEAIEMALNRGRTYAMAGPVHISGLKASFRSPRPEDICAWEEFYKIFLEHYRYKLVNCFYGLLQRYGNLQEVCPSPLLSPLIAGCLESGRDLSAGGARYKLIAPLMNGIATAIDSLWAIRSMVFGPEAVFTLPELADCLINDWGWDMKEPFYSQALGPDRLAIQAERYKKLRLHAHGLSKFGQGNAEVDAFGQALVRDLVEMAGDLVRRPPGIIAQRLAELRKRFGTRDHPFDFVICPAIATFEDYGGIGSFLGASADGRRSGQPVASDFSASPTPLDLPVCDQGRPAIACLKGWAAKTPGAATPAQDPIGLGLSNGSPADINIRENFPLDQLVSLLGQFARGEIGPNMLSISCADHATLLAAQQYPERYDLVRMRMGGWSEFFIAMFPEHQEHHKRRPIFEAAPPPRPKLSNGRLNAKSDLIKS